MASFRGGPVENQNQKRSSSKKFQDSSGYAFSFGIERFTVRLWFYHSETPHIFIVGTLTSKSAWCPRFAPGVWALTWA
jgi:hypothetical protein